jgi:flagellar assembly protein FliH
MSSPVLPAEKLTAYQRWELTALGGQRAGAHVTLPTAAEIERLHQSAHAEGLAAGLAEGRAQAAERIARLDALVSSMTRELRAAESQVAEDLLSLALELARLMVRETLAVRRELIVPLVREAMQQMALFGAPSRLALHPADAALVRQDVGEQLDQLGCRLVEDGQIERGGCRIEGPATHVDATLATRWDRIVAALGRDRAWLEHGAARAAPPAEEAP